MNSENRKSKNLWKADVVTKVVDKEDVKVNTSLITFLFETRHLAVTRDNPFRNIVEALPRYKFRTVADPNNELNNYLLGKDNISWFIPFSSFKGTLTVPSFESTGNKEESFKIVKWLAGEHYSKMPGIVRAMSASWVEAILGIDYRTSPIVVLVNTKIDISGGIKDKYKDLGLMYRLLYMCEKLNINYLSIYDKDLETKLKQINAIGNDVSLNLSKGSAEVKEVKVDETTDEQEQSIDNIINDINKEEAKTIDIGEDEITF